MKDKDKPSTYMEISNKITTLKLQIQRIRHEVFQTNGALMDPGLDLNDPELRQQLTESLEEALKTCNEIAE